MKILQSKDITYQITSASAQKSWKALYHSVAYFLLSSLVHFHLCAMCSMLNYLHEIKGKLTVLYLQRQM